MHNGRLAVLNAIDECYRRLMARIFIVISLIMCMSISCSASDVSPKTDISQMSIEDLMNIEVTSVSKKAEKLEDSSASVFVITSDDIRRTGATCIPEALRLVPGLHVAKINANRWVVACRGFSETYTNKLLVLIDGRSVYTPLFAGVYWDMQEMVMGDIDRIEIIRGPGATMWGANAVSGVINVITKSSSDTQGTYASQLYGSDVRGKSTIRYGGQLGANGTYRIYGKYLNWNDALHEDGQSAFDGWQQNKQGFRADWKLPNSGNFTLQGDFYNEQADQEAYMEPTVSIISNDQISISGSNIMAKWSQSKTPTSNTSLNLYYDYVNRVEGNIGERRRTVDLDFQNRQVLNDRHELVWGLGYRQSSCSIKQSEYVNFDITGETTQLYSAFCQDDITLSEKTKLTVGSKFEHNSYTGFEVQPNIRFLWTPQSHQTFWASISKAVRIPSLMERDSQFYWLGYTRSDGYYYVTKIYGNKNFQSEDLMAYEAGYRIQPSEKTSIDLTAYYNVYNNYRSFEIGTPQIMTSPFFYILVPLTIDNKANVNVYGWELSAKVNPNENWQLSAGYTYCRMNMIPDADCTDTLSLSNDAYYPHSQFQFRSSMDLKNNIELDIEHYLSSKFNDEYYYLPGWSRTDVRLGWKKSNTTEISLGVQNLFKSRHKEAYGTTYEVASYIGRNVYGQLSWRY